MTLVEMRVNCRSFSNVDGCFGPEILATACVSVSIEIYVFLKCNIWLVSA